ncbi:SMI1/KNR4 family protein [Bordetella ansorpii]|nr:SMI1/KNR4 family protein [Bordetella ansorpii]
MIERLIQAMSVAWHANPAASLDVLDEIWRVTGLFLPADYRAFMAWADGGEGRFADVYLSFWSASDILDLNRDYQIARYLGAQVLAIGSDGGPICFLLDYRLSETPMFCSVNFGDLDPADIRIIAPSFGAALARALAGGTDPDRL